ncbi:MAG: hypothetical protein HY097_06650 [Nitrospinae bacterium]|nr:hypothetical protein [Nitrospinota bacterium]
MVKQRTWWPHHVFKAGSLIIITLVVVIILAAQYQVPDDAPDIVPHPDDGQYILGPEWYFLLLWQPFWHFTGEYKHLLSLTVIVPAIIFLFLTLLPFIKIPFWGRKGGEVETQGNPVEQMGFFKKLIYNTPILVIAIFVAYITFKSGYQAKVLGCDSCHNSAMGVKMGLPPVDVAEYYKVDRARQIETGKYRAGKAVGADFLGRMIYDIGGTETYKDANWQMRHMYEPTFTW